MSISPNTSISVKRLTGDGNRKSDYGGLNIYTGIPCCLQQLSEAPEQAYENAASYKFFKAMDFGKIYDIQEQDRVTDAAGNVYIVKGVKTWNEPEIGGEMEIILSQKV